MKVRDIVSQRRVISLREDDNLGLAMQVMLWAGIHHLPVVNDHGKLIGLLDEHDILERQTKVGPAAAIEAVGSIMSLTVATVAPDEQISEAALRLIGRGVSCLVVMDKEQMVGVLTTTDLVQHLAEQQPASDGEPRQVRDVMHRKPITAAADDYLMDALARMAARNIRHLPVVDGEGVVVGMLSERDVRSAIGDPTAAVQLERTRVRLQSLRVSDVMSHKVISIREQAPLGEASSRLVDQRIGALPVVDEADRLIGIISYVDLLDAENFQGAPRPTKRAVPPRAAQLGS